MPRLSVVLPVPMLPERAIYSPGSMTEAKRLPRRKVAASSGKKMESIRSAELIIELLVLWAPSPEPVPFWRQRRQTRATPANHRHGATQDGLLSEDCRLATSCKSHQCA